MTHIHDFVDIHTHILPGLDDGPQNTEGSLSLARCYEAVGIKKIIATPHFLPGTAWASTGERVLEAVQSFQRLLDREGILLKIEPGMEIAYHEKLGTRIMSGLLLPLAESGYYLIEPLFHGDLKGMIKTLGALMENGIHIILAHPERIEYFQELPDSLDTLVDKGLLIQVNTGSLLGCFGHKAKKTADYLAKKQHVHLFASDAHNSGTRPPLTKGDWKALAGSRQGELLVSNCMRNVEYLLKNR